MSATPVNSLYPAPSGAKKAARLAGYVLLSLKMPGFDQLLPACAERMGRLLQETLEVELVAKSLLTNAPGSTAAGPQQSGDEAPPRFARHEDQMHFTFFVVDAAAAEKALAGEICRLGFSEWAELSRYDVQARRCETRQPQSSTGPSVSALCVEVLRGAGLLPA